MTLHVWASGGVPLPEGRLSTYSLGMAPGELSESPPRRGRLRDLARRARWPLVIAVVAALLGWWRWWRPVVVTVVEVTAGEVVEEALARHHRESA